MNPLAANDLPRPGDRVRIRGYAWVGQLLQIFNGEGADERPSRRAPVAVIRQPGGMKYADLLSNVEVVR
jgi:hypothetical protein